MSFKEWEKVKLSEISVGNKGNYGIGASAVDYDEELYTYLRITDITDDGRLNKEGLKSVADEDAKNYLLSEDDIVFARTGNSTGRSYFYEPSDGELVYAGFLIKFKLDKTKVNPRYIKLYTMTNEYRNWIETISTGSTRKNINEKMYGDMDIKLPSREEQDYIVNLIEPLNQKIEVNNKINKRLEDMAQSIFKYWFVDFEFPNEEGKNYKSSDGEMVESELGMIPKGWKVKSLDDIVELIIDYRGKTPKKLGHDWSKSGVMAISAKNIKNNKLVNLDVAKYVDDELYGKWMKDKLKFGDVLMTSEAPLGELYYLADNDEYCLSQRVYALRSNEDILKKSVLYYMLNSKNVMAEIMNRATGTTVVGIRQVELRKVKMIIPDSALQNQFSDLMNSILLKINKLEKENEKLSNLRDTLLPNLMNSEMRVLVEE